MIDLGLTNAERAQFEKALVAAQPKRRTRFAIHDENERVIEELRFSSGLLEGEVTVDNTAEVSRSLRILLAEDIPFDPVMPRAAFIDRHISVKSGTWVPALDRWVDVPVFFGPVATYSRDGATVEIEAMGKESLAQEPHLLWRRLEFNDGKRVSVAIQELLEAMGERHFDFPANDEQLGEPETFGRETEVWEECQNLARDIDRQLFYDGAGECRMRRWPENAHYTFKTGPGGQIASAVTKHYDASRLRNVVQVHGTRGTVEVTATAKPNASHPLSPESLARRGENRNLVELRDTSLNKVGIAERRAEGILRRLLNVDASVEFDSVPIPHLEPGDLCKIGDADGETTFRLSRFTLPLGPASMSVGYNRRIKYRRIRNVRTTRHRRVHRQ